MKHETEKLEDALKCEDCERAVDYVDMVYKFEEKYHELPDDVVRQAARRYAEVLPYIDTLLKIDMSSGDREKAALSVIAVKANIAAIVAREG